VEEDAEQGIGGHARDPFAVRVRRIG